ncbi:MAG: hypothetical protein GY859_44000, partial [Desulfobacterales bacterium]|nr:hypothetical protein [Desulfobacterales bacterium]
AASNRKQRLNDPNRPPSMAAERDAAPGENRGASSRRYSPPLAIPLGPVGSAAASCATGQSAGSGGPETCLAGPGAGSSGDCCTGTNASFATQCLGDGNNAVGVCNASGNSPA